MALAVQTSVIGTGALVNGMLEGLNFSGKQRLPLILQSEAAECGLACLAMVAGYHGRKLSLVTLRHRHAISLKGSNLQALIGIADQLQFNSRPLRLELEELVSLRAPAILHWNLSHFVVLKRVTARYIEIHDPAVGVRRLSLQAASKHFTGVALELLPAPGFMVKDERQNLRLRDLLTEAVGLRPFLLQLFMLSAALQVFALLAPLYTQLIVDEAIVRQDYSLLSLMAAGFLIVLVIQMTLDWIRSWMVIYFSNTLSMQLQGNLLRHALRLPLSFFSKRHVGDVMSRFGSMSAVQSLLTTGFVQAVLDGLLMITTLGALLLYQPMLTAIVVGLLAIYGLLRRLRYRPLRELAHENLVNSAEASSQFMETLRGMPTIKQFGLELARLTLWQNRYVDVTNTNIRISRLNMSFGIANDLLLGIGSIAVFYVGAMLVFEQNLTIGMLMAFIAYKGQFMGTGAALIDQWISWKMLSLHLDRLADIATTAPEEESSAPTLPAVQWSGALRARRLRFRYSPTEPLLLDDTNIEVAAGACVVIMGPSGCGKSTLMRILQGLEKATEGVVEFDGADIRQLGLANYRKMVASVTQEDRLLTGSIAENITLFSELPDHEWLVECARLCGIHYAILRMPMNYHSLISDMGDALSAGERQRLMLARAIYRRPKILFLDEATSNLDMNLDAQINQTLAGLGITRVIVTHRPTPLRYADQSFQLRAGKLEPFVADMLSTSHSSARESAPHSQTA